MKIEIIGIFGGSGFVGRQLANMLVDDGYHLRIFTRSRNHAREVWSLPNTEVIEFDVYDEAALNTNVSGCDAIINLVGRLNEKGDDGDGFRRTHTELTRSIIKAASNNQVKRYLHMSAMNAEPFAPSYYLRSKGEAENAAMAAHDEGLPTTVFRPSVIFGAGDDFFNRFAALLRISPIIFPLACPNTRLQPVYVGDVARAMIRTLRDRSTLGQRYELAGPEQKTLIELVRYTAEVSGVSRKVLPLNDVLSKLQANVCEYIPGKPFSRDNLRSASEDSVCRGANGLDKLGIRPTSIAEIVPQYLARRHERGRYYDMRVDARRSD